MASQQARKAALAHLARFDGLGSDDVDRALDAAAPYMVETDTPDPRHAEETVDRWAAADRALDRLLQEAYRKGIELGDAGLARATGAPLLAEHDGLMRDMARGEGYVEAIESHRDQLDAVLTDQFGEPFEIASLASAVELAAEHGVTRQTVNAWRKQPDFPAPVGQLAGADIYRRSAVRAFLGQFITSLPASAGGPIEPTWSKGRLAEPDIIVPAEATTPAAIPAAVPKQREGEVMMGAMVDGTTVGVDHEPDSDDDGPDFDVDMGAAPGAGSADVWDLGEDDDD